jgi:hypothetical protein
VLVGIVFMLLAGWWRVRDWRAAVVWEQLHERLLVELRQAGKLDLSRARLDSVCLRAKRGSVDGRKSGGGEHRNRFWR